MDDEMEVLVTHNLQQKPESALSQEADERKKRTKQLLESGLNAAVAETARFRNLWLDNEFEKHNLKCKLNDARQ
jgi:hypothetical protein